MAAAILYAAKNHRTEITSTMQNARRIWSFTGINRFVIIKERAVRPATADIITAINILLFSFFLLFALISNRFLPEFIIIQIILYNIA